VAVDAGEITELAEVKLKDLSALPPERQIMFIQRPGKAFFGGLVELFLLPYQTFAVPKISFSLVDFCCFWLRFELHTLRASNNDPLGMLRRQSGVTASLLSSMKSSQN
jgi:hypothetical protein